MAGTAAAVASECLRNYLDGDRSQVAYMIVDGSLKLRQDDTQLSLSLGSNGLGTQLTDAFFQVGRWHSDGDNRK